MKKPDRSKYPGLLPHAQSVEPDPDLYIRIGQRISEARDTRRLTQEALGSVIGESGITISRWETAVRKPNVEDLEKLARALDQSILFFVERHIPDTETTLLVLTRAVGELNENDREELLAIARLKLDRDSKSHVARKLESFEKSTINTND